MRDLLHWARSRARAGRWQAGPLLAVLGGVVLVATQLPAGGVPAARAATPVSSLYFETDPYDGMGAGRTRLATSDDSTFGSYDNGGPWTTIGVSGPVGWVLVMAWGPDGAQLTPGTYNHVGAPGDTGKPVLGFGWSGEGSGGCGAGDASFVVHEVEYTGTLFSKLSLSFKTECGATGAWAAGELRYNTSAPAYPAILQSPDTRSPFDLGSLAIGAESPVTSFALANAGSGSITLGSGAMSGAASGDFTLLDDTCSGATLAEGASCTFGVRFSPGAPGDRVATLEFSTTTGLGHRRIAFKGFGLTPTVTTLDVPADTVYGDLVLVSHTRPAPALPPGYQAAISLHISGQPSLMAPCDANGDATFTVQLDPGSYTVSAAFGGTPDQAPSASDPASVTVGSVTHTTMSSSLNPALDTQDVTITARVVPDRGTLSGGILSIVDAFDGSTIASGQVGPGQDSVAVTRSFATGDHLLTASYAGDGLYAASTSSLTQQAADDQEVLASSLGVSAATFYPAKDGYLDTVQIHGTLGEPASVAVTVYSPGGAIVREADLGDRLAGSYGYAWNGRNDAGTMLPTGTYRVVQEVTDRGDNVLTATHFVALSAKKLAWSTHTITLYGGQYGLTGDPGSGSISRSASAYYRGVRLNSGTSWVAVRYAFTLRSATVYKPLTFRVLGKSPTRTSGYAGLWNRTYGSSRDVDAYDVRKVGPSYAWYPITLDATAHRSGRSAYGMVFVGYLKGKRSFDVAKVRLTYQYAVLK